MRFDPQDPHRANNDRFILSKGHAAPVLYAAWAEAGIVPRDELLTLRQLDSDLEGHPTPRLPSVDVATGSLGQGICAGVGTALNARRIGSDYRTYVLLGDGECAEGSVLEAATAAEFHKLDSLCAIVDVNGLGQSRPTMFGHDSARTRARWRACGWNAIVMDGHDMQACSRRSTEARRTKDRPTVLLARTLKGKGVSLMEGKEGWHGKALKRRTGGRGHQGTDGPVRGGGSFDVPRPAVRRLNRSRPRERRSCRSRRPRTSWARAWPLARRTARRWRKLGDADAASWRSMPT